MTGVRIFIDTAPLIYLIEENPGYFKKVSVFIADALQTGAILTTSVLTVSEFQIKPRKLNQRNVIEKFENIVKANFRMINVTWQIAELSAILRAKYSSLRAMDSLQIACAVNSKREQFITNDRRMKIVKDIPILLVKDLM